MSEDDDRPKGPRFRIEDLVADPGFAPRSWQTSAPADHYLGGKPPVGDSPDLQRILALPRREPPDATRLEAMVELMSERLSNGKPSGACACRELAPDRFKDGRNGCITSLRPIQAWALFETIVARGLLAPIGVGHGKTLLDILTPLVMPDCKLAVLLCPPGLVGQLIGNYRLIAQHFRVPSLVVHGNPWSNIVPGAPVLHVYPYSRLSRPESSSWLENLNPDTVIADEVHKIRNVNGAGASRVMRLYDRRRPRFVGWTGSLTDSSPRDYAHIAGMALRQGSPLPLDPEVVEDWHRALDPDSDWPAPPGALLDLCEPGEHVYDGFRRRLHDTTGVVHTTEAAVSADLEINERDPGPIPPGVLDVIATIRATWQRPDGEWLIDKLQLAKVCREAACGFYYRWRYPRGEPRALIEEWLEVRKAWHQELRAYLKDREEHVDSPLLAARAAHRAMVGYEGPLPVWHSETFADWLAIKDQVKPETEAVRLEVDGADYLARDAAAWALENRGIVWYGISEFGRWVAELSGLPMYGGGPNGGGLVDDEGRILERGDRSVILSLKAHGTGRDGLQFIFHRSLTANPPGNATLWEQKLGRLHRDGQAAPVVYDDVYRHTDEMRAAVDKAVARALYVSRTLGTDQKIRSGFRLQ